MDYTIHSIFRVSRTERVGSHSDNFYMDDTTVFLIKGFAQCYLHLRFHNPILNLLDGKAKKGYDMW